MLMLKRAAALMIGGLLLLQLSCLTAGEPPVDKFTVESLRGRVVWMAEAMARLHGAKSVPEAAERTLALETGDGQLHPLLEDVRGRAFRVDERLRRMDVELLVRRYPRTPVLQVVAVYEITPQGKFEIDYCCDVCAIAMFELKACECCQGETELRRRRVFEPSTPPKP
jgi:hypothetical protein